MSYHVLHYHVMSWYSMSTELLVLTDGVVEASRKKTSHVGARLCWSGDWRCLSGSSRCCGGRFIECGDRAFGEQHVGEAYASAGGFERVGPSEDSELPENHPCNQLHQIPFLWGHQYHHAGCGSSPHRQGAALGSVFCTITLPITNYRFRKSMLSSWALVWQLEQWQHHRWRRLSASWRITSRRTHWAMSWSFFSPSSRSLPCDVKVNLLRHWNLRETNSPSHPMRRPRHRMSLCWVCFRVSATLWLHYLISDMDC